VRAGGDTPRWLIEAKRERSASSAFSFLGIVIAPSIILDWPDGTPDAYERRHDEKI
jgi:hypothetical protein